MTTRAMHSLASTIRRRVADITGQLATCTEETTASLLSPRVRRTHRLRTIHATLALDNCVLSLKQVAELMRGKASPLPETTDAKENRAISRNESTALLSRMGRPAGLPSKL